MLADAIRAETWRLSKNTATVFWSVVFLPVMGLVMSVISNVFLKSNAGAITVNGQTPPELAQMLTGEPIRVIETVITSVGDRGHLIVEVVVAREGEPPVPLGVLPAIAYEIVRN